MEAPEEDTEFLTLTQPVKGATLRLSETFFDQDVPCTAEPGHLLAVSNHFGWVVAASSQGGFGLFSLPTLRSRVRSASPHDTPKVDPSLHVPTPAPVDFLRFAMGEKLVVAGLRDGSIAVWRLKSLVEGQSSPLKTLPALIAGEPLIDLCPNPAPDSPLLAVLGPSAAPLTIFNLETSAVHATFPSDLGATSACWSVKGKQLAVGTASGTIVQLSPEGEQKALVPTPTDLSSNGAFEVRSVEWLENNVFLATYAKPRTKSEDDVEHEDEVYVITKAGQEMSYTKFADPCPPFGMMGRQGRRWVGRFRNWEPFKHLLVMVNAPSADIGVLAQAAAYSPTSPSNGWATLTLPEDTRPTMPTGDKGDDACPLALELDLSASAEDGGDPAVLVYTSRGALVYWTFKNERASGRYEGMIKSRDVLTQENDDAPPAAAAAGQAEAKPSPATAPVSKPTAFGAFAAPPAFGTASTPPAFGSSAAPSKPPVSAFGSTAFGASTTSSTPTFGSTSGFGSTPALGSGFSAFGSSTAPKSPFGTPAVSSATTTAPAAGSAFAAVPSSGGFSAFGSVASKTTSGGGSGGFGAAAASTAPKASPFGSGSAFGSAPAFGGGATTVPSSGGFAAFGAAKPAAGGFGAFGGGGGGSAAAMPGKSVFGAGATASAFGSGGIVAASPSSSSTTTTAPKFSFAPTATRGAKGSDDEDDEEGMGDDDDDSAKPRVDEPPDLEPTKTGLDFGQSVREAEKAGPPKRDTAPAPATESLSGGFGSLGFGATSASTASPSSSQGLGTSVFGAAAAVTSTAVTPGFAAPAKTPAFGFGAAATAPKTSPFGGSPFSFGQQPKQGESPASQETKPATSAFGTSGGGGFAGFAAKKDGGNEQPKPTFSFAPKTPETTAKPSEPAAPVAKADEPKTNETPSTPAKDDASTSPAPAPAPPPPAFSFAPAPAKSPAATEEKKPSGSAFGFGGTAGGFGAFAAPKSTPAAKDDEQKNSAAPSSPVTAEGDSTKESPREEDEDEDEAEQDDEDSEEEESNEDSDDSGAESDGTDADKSPTTEAAAPTKPAFSFAPSGSSAAFPKPTGAGGFGAFAGGSSTGFGFGAAAPAKSPSTGTGFGFGVAATPSPSASSTGFSFAPKTPPPAAAATDAKVESKPAFSFAPAAKPALESSAPETKPTFSFAPKSPAATSPAATSAPVSIPAASSPKAEKPKDTTKSLFGFASSPPEEKLRSSGDGSLLSRLGAKEPSSEDEQDQEEDAEEEDEGAPGEEDEEAEEEEEGASGDELEESEGDEETAPAVAPSGQPSLLSRLSPAPPSPTPSPTPSQPTAVKEPEAAKAPEPVKAPSFSFAPPPADAPKPPSFSFAPASSAQQTAPSLTPATPPVPSPVTSKSPGGFLNFTSTAPRSSSPLSAPPLAVPSLSAAPAKVTPAPAPTAGSFGAPASKPSFSFGAPAAALSPSPAIDVAGAPKASPPPALPVPLATTKSLAPTPAPVSTPPAPAPAAKPVEPTAPPALSVASAPVPKLGSQLIAAGGAKPPGVTEQGMAGEFLKAYLGVQQDFELLRKNSAIIKDFVAGLGRPCHPPLTKDSRPQLDAQHWSFGDVDKLKQLTREAQPGVEALHAAAVAQKRRITELQSQILKAETKREEASRFLRARSDPAFAKLVRVRQLGPEQTENQRKIRHQVEAVRAKIEQLEEHLLSLKKQLAKEKLGQSTLQAPSLDSIQRAMRNITVAATEKGLELDEIATRLHRMQVAERGNKPTTPRKTSFAMSPLKAVLDQSSILRQSASPSPRSSAPVNGQDASEAAAAALGAERVAGNLKKALLSLRGSAPLVNRTACGSQTAQLSRPSAEIQLAFSQGPITGNRLPRPRHFSPPRAPVELPLKSGSLSKAGPVLPASPASPATPSTAGPKPPFSFALGGSKPEPAAASLGSAAVAPPPAFPSLNLKAAPSFSFATPVASSPPPSSSATSGSRGLRTSSRTHAGAAQLKSNGTPPSSASSSFDWGPLPASLATTTPAKSASAPANFISLSSTPAASPAPSKLPSSLGTPGLPASLPHKAPISFGTTSSATPVKPPAPSSSFGFGSTTPAATAASAPSFSFGTSTPTAPPASKAPAFAGSFGFGNSSSTTPSKPAPSFSFGASSTPTAPPPAAKAPTGFSFGAPGTASATPKPAFSFAGPAPPATSKPAEAAQEESDGSNSDSAAEEEQTVEHEEEEEEWEGDEFGDVDYGDNNEEEEEGRDAISEHTDEE